MESVASALPPSLRAGFSAAMGQALLLPAGVLMIGLVGALCCATPRHLVARHADAGPTNVAQA